MVYRERINRHRRATRLLNNEIVNELFMSVTFSTTSWKLWTTARSSLESPLTIQMGNIEYLKTTLLLRSVVASRRSLNNPEWKKKKKKKRKRKRKIYIHMYLNEVYRLWRWLTSIILVTRFSCQSTILQMQNPKYTISYGWYVIIDRNSDDASG